MMATTTFASHTCPRCGAALGGATQRCPSCLAELSDPWERHERWLRLLLVLVCVAGALYLAGTAVLGWVRGAR